MERAFAAEIESLKLGDGAVFRGEGILAVTKALLQSGVSYVGGYQGAPVSHLLDVMVQARDYMDELGVHVEACTNEASAAAMLGASIAYPVRGAVTWKSIVGTNVAADALSYLSTAGVMGGALIIAGEDYGEGASVALERTHAYALKSQLWMLDPRPDLPTIVRMVEKGFELSEASSTPVIVDLRIRACHVQGEFAARANRAAALSTRHRGAPAGFDYERLSHPPATFRQEKHKIEVRLPAARRFIAEQKLNESFPGDLEGVGIIVQGGLYNTLQRALHLLGLANAFGESRVPILALNVVYPLVPEEITSYCAGKRAVLLLEEGQPEFIEQDIATTLRRSDVQARLHGKDLMAMAGEYSAELMVQGLRRFLGEHEPRLDLGGGARWLESVDGVRKRAAALLGAPLPARPPNFCIGCPERPVFAALKIAEKKTGRPHISGDIGCHAFATFEPFSMGNSILGYGMSLASAAAVGPMMAKRPLAVMGDGGFWHNGLLSGVASSLLNKGDAVLLVMKNGYASATGTQELISSPPKDARDASGRSAVHADRTIENALAGLGVKWVKTVHTYHVAEMQKTLSEALTTEEGGLKVIVAEGECQLERQRRAKPEVARRLAAGERVLRVKYGVDEDTCTGDHSCIRLSGCPTLTVKDNPDPLRRDPVATVIEGCVGCGLCGENAHAATLCPSFYRAEVVQNPSMLDRAVARLRALVVPA
ncbi:MAG: indolepyruvate ferredoxin oxidoreductase subunit alpha [Betaproteobacteria bacterium]|nr:indolepyruvate ferredoxin oxidoreductase subunit alpha [Betaproteobacteria bacterium]MDH5220836.1 indolepyruvate ferredoxin oxidoreductase subunit alpha [Betaproteobacteria bacterium]MDH5349834.1 indolepyruvate ferredoxin oxidoreductase subunit alpha [Betaproteobacteria bacterium]